MKSVFVLSFSLLILSLSSVVEGREPTTFSYAKGDRFIDAMIPNAEDITENFAKAYPDIDQRLEYVFDQFSPIQILDNVGLVKANNEVNKLGYVRKYCGIVMSASLMKDRSSLKPPLVQLVMMTAPFSPIQVTLPFRSSKNMKMDKKTLDYYSNKYGGKVICADKIIVGNLIEGGINYILPHNFDSDKDLIETNHTDKDYIQIF
ncbi:hypothetical protein FHS24_002501 [Psychrobacter luti]|uniref:Uncharacterized protein n=1 Tax=Psychrobacter luti TaxID=198481 RepID=A0A839TJ10_9GAMM|nr:hypothetical protein [Psychrobacter luti]MBB3107965.1 hypothetical protein [Psychrobacter luti]